MKIFDVQHLHNRYSNQIFFSRHSDVDGDVVQYRVDKQKWTWAKHLENSTVWTPEKAMLPSPLGHAKFEDDGTLFDVVSGSFGAISVEAKEQGKPAVTSDDTYVVKIALPEPEPEKPPLESVTLHSGSRVEKTAQPEPHIEPQSPDNDEEEEDEEDEEKDEDEFVKYDVGKPRPSLLPGAALLEIVDVLEYGARKYSVDGWRECDDTRRYLDAALRHLYAHLGGAAVDEESGLRHLAHAATNLLFLLELEGKERK